MRAPRVVAATMMIAVLGCDPAPGPESTDRLAGALAPDGELLPGALDALAGAWVSRDAGGRLDAVRAIDGGVLVADDAGRDPAERARAFLADYGAVIGLDAVERRDPPIAVRDVAVDATGAHVRIDQRHDGRPVFGGQIVVHVDDRGVTAVNGTWIAGLRVPAAPAIDEAAARATAVAAAGKAAPGVAARATAAELAVIRTGTVERRPGLDHLAWAVEVEAGDRHQVWIDAVTGAPLASYALTAHAKHRIVYAPVYLPDQPNLFVQRREGGMPSLLPPVNNLFAFSGSTYDLFAQGFGRDSFDGAGAIMRTVYLINQNCPNAYWDGATTNYCPGFDLDDVVAHEWGHAYTQHTHGLVYAYQSGALNESYSDIWGETVDLHNGADGLAGANHGQPAPAGVRWAVGEDFGTGHGEYELLLRDMWDPDRLGSPGKVTSENYACGTGDGGGVHTNSGVPNHAYALLVDGATYNGVTVTGIGFVKAAHIYYRAMTVYQTPTTDFEQHADALEMSCADLIGLPLAGFLGATAAGPITAADCAQVQNAVHAVELRTPPDCGFEPLLLPDPPPACTGAVTTYSQDWSGGIPAAWTTTSTGVNPEWPGYAWEPAPRPGGAGTAAFAIDSTAGTCAPGGDYSGRFALTSPVLTAPPSGHAIELRFDHLVETELGYDGGNLMISVAGGAFALVPPDAYAFNPPRTALAGPPPLGNNTNPKAGELAWHGADGGQTTGSWGTTVVRLDELVGPGQTYQLRFELGIDGCNGLTGWYLGDLAVLDCPPSP